ncbi:MAG: DUF1349 domain-containing protein [Planctomycetes bacterium]|nr:DUF1349 domain-containing protein [Planctomycetota bacterium]
MREEKVDLAQFNWLNPPEQVELNEDGLELVTLPETDFWQRTHYGFKRASGHAFLTRLWDDFTFTFSTEFFYEALFDQCGLMLYIDDENWAKASIEFEDEAQGQLGSVVTNDGWSDWAVAPIPTEVNRMYYRISRRASDFRIDCSTEGDVFRQMRIFHMTGDLTKARVGVYACSPSDSSFTARFSQLTVAPSVWE